MRNKGPNSLNLSIKILVYPLFVLWASLLENLAHKYHIFLQLVFKLLMWERALTHHQRGYQNETRIRQWTLPVRYIQVR